MNKTTSLIASLILFVVGIVLAIAGNFAHGYVTSQLNQERIKMPVAEATASLPQASQDALKPYLGTDLDTGPKAQVYANNYIWEHMMASSQGKTYTEVSGAFMKASKDPTADKAEVAKLGELRQTLFMGDSLRSILLTAYAFWLMGSIALYAGYAVIAAAALIAALSFLRRPMTSTIVTPATFGTPRHA
ncbi:hypothetical protein [Deinococcus ficus]|uniref:Aromatic ring-opening dioxygenase LigA n=1 Tax=Deinococcus ficus TaxID=317577 RepID=A0A221T132_9DEIO|nr:hypothetical protein [Deinococcus ficus]ASN82589.1 hypothetical protein DFI_15550 [Deinococcus ficus]